MNPIVKKYLQKQIFKQKGAIGSAASVDFAYKALETRMKNLGLDINLIKTQRDLDQALGFVKNIEDQVFAKQFGDTLKKKESAEIFDLKGRKIKNTDNIMGGEELPPPGSRGGKDDIAAPVQSAEETIKNMIMAENKKNIAKMKNRKIVKDAVDNVSPGFVKGDRKYNAQLVAEDLADKKFGKDFYDLDQKQQMDLYGEALDGLSVDLDDFAQGGRAGFKVGSPSKRTFLKVMGGLAATLAAIKSGLIGAPKKEITKQIVKETATDVASAPPQYFFDLANKIRLLGKPSKVKPQERVNEYNYVGKNGDEYTLTEDISTGDMQITKDKTGIGIADDKSFDTIKDRTVMDYRKGRGDETTKGTPADEYDEFKVEFDRDGTMGDGDVIDENIKKEIIEEASDIPKQKIKRAGGGVAYMLGE